MDFMEIIIIVVFSDSTCGQGVYEQVTFEIVLQLLILRDKGARIIFASSI